MAIGTLLSEKNSNPCKLYIRDGCWFAVYTYLQQDFGQYFRAFRYVLLLLLVGHDRGDQQAAQTDDGQRNADGGKHGNYRTINRDCYKL